MTVPGETTEVTARTGSTVGVSVIIVNWNTRAHLQGCLQSVVDHGLRQASMEIVVVDNGSSDGSREMVRDEWPTIRLLENAENEGFSRANNRGIRASTGEFLLLINSDARLRPGALDEMLRVMRSDERAAVVGPRLEFGDGRWQRTTAGRAPSLRTAINHYLFVDRLGIPHPWFAGLYLSRDVRRAFRPDWVSSACMLVRRAALEEVGLLDERFFIYMDDVDLCQRVRDRGWNVWYCPDARVIHYMSRSSSEAGGIAPPAAVRAFNAYFARRYGARRCAALRAAEVAGFGIRGVALSIAAALRPTRIDLVARARAQWAFCRAGLEPVPSHEEHGRG